MVGGWVGTKPLQHPVGEFLGSTRTRGCSYDRRRSTPGIEPTRARLPTLSPDGGERAGFGGGLVFGRARYA